MRWAWRSASGRRRAWCGRGPSRPRSSPNSPSPTIIRPLTILREAGLGADLAGTIVLRRLVAADGRSRAFVNDEPASVGLLRELGDSAGRDPGPGRAARSAGPGDSPRAARRLRRSTRSAPTRSPRPGASGGTARERAAEAARLLAESRAEEDLLRHHYAEIDALSPEGDEEERLGARRALLQSAERLGETIGRGDRRDRRRGRSAAGAGARPAPARTRPRPGPGPARQRRRGGRARRRGDRRGAGRAGRGRARRSNSTRARSKKSRSGCSRCARWPASTGGGRRSAGAARSDGGAAGRDRKRAPRASRMLERAKRRRRAPAIIAAAESRLARRAQRAASRLDAAVAAELEPLRLDKARFRTVLTPLAEADWGEHGMRARAFRGRDQPRRAVRAAGADRLGRRAVALHAGAEAGAGRHLVGADPDLRRGRQRHRRRRRGGGRRAAAASRRTAAGAGRDPFAAGRGARRASLADRQDARRRAPP